MSQTVLNLRTGKPVTAPLHKNAAYGFCGSHGQLLKVCGWIVKGENKICAIHPTIVRLIFVHLAGPTATAVHEIWGGGGGDKCEPFIKV